MATIHSHVDAANASTLRRDAGSVTPAPRRMLRGALAGGAAALVASGLMLWLGRAWGGAILAQLLSDRATAIVPLDVFGRALDALESDAKPLTLVGLTLLQTLLGAALGALYARLARPTPRARLVGGLALAAVVWLGLSLVAAPLGEVGVFARHAAGGPWTTQAIFALAALLFGALTAFCVPWPAPNTAGANPARRRLLSAAALALPAAGAALYIGRYADSLRKKNALVGASVDSDANEQQPVAIAQAAAVAPEFAFDGMPPAVTPTDQFYIVSKNFVDPKVDAAGWTLEIAGMVANPMTLSYTDLTSRPANEFQATLECISNRVGGKYISNGVWHGFPLATLLDDAGLQPGVVDIELHAADGYVESIPLEKARDPRVMIVHTLNGAPLPDEHGKPARLIVPGIFGMKNVKWLTKIVPVGDDIDGFWEDRGWSDVAGVVTMSRIDTPRSGTRVPVGQLLRVGGVAFAGDRGISAVEVSLDGGKTWAPAQLAEAPSSLTWRLWEYAFTPTTPGNLAPTVRATDGQGNLQIEERRSPLPDGATGYHSIGIKVVEKS